MDDFRDELRRAAPRPERPIDPSVLRTTARRRQRNRRGLVGLGIAMVIGLVATLVVRDRVADDSTLVAGDGLTLDRQVNCAITVSGEPGITKTVPVDFNNAPVTHTVGAYTFVFSVVPLDEADRSPGSEPVRVKTEVYTGNLPERSSEDQAERVIATQSGVPSSREHGLAFGLGAHGVRMDCATDGTPPIDPNALDLPADFQAPDGTILDAMPVGDSAGWMLTEHQLLHTDDDGTTWQATQLAGFGQPDAWAFVDASTAVVARVGNNEVSLARTSDGGHSTQLTSLGNVADASALSLSFVDRTTGYLAVSEVAAGDASTATSSDLYRTIDGGATWSVIAEGVPVAKVYFATALVGAGTATGSATGLYATRDGGVTWSRLRPPGWEADDPSGEPVYDVVWQDEQHVIVQSARQRDASLDVAYYDSGDRGATWQEVDIHDDGSAYATAGPQPQMSAVGPAHVRLLAPDRTNDAAEGDFVVRGPLDSGSEWTTLSRLPCLRMPLLRYASTSRAWITSQSMLCRTPRPATVARSTDGGRTWSTVAVSVTNAASGIAPPPTTLGPATTASGRPAVCQTSPVAGDVATESSYWPEGGYPVARVVHDGDLGGPDTPRYLQVQRGEADFTQAVAVDARAEILDFVPLGHDQDDGRNRGAMFVGNDGNTALSGGVVVMDGCSLTRATGTDGEPFSVVYFGTGRGCAPACYPSVQTYVVGNTIEVVVANATAQRDDGEPPELTDELLFDWTSDRYRLEGTQMILLSSDSGTARHADLPVPKEQGYFQNWG